MSHHFDMMHIISLIKAGLVPIKTKLLRLGQSMQPHLEVLFINLYITFPNKREVHM
jgi:hypothetical protein